MNTREEDDDPASVDVEEEEDDDADAKDLLLAYIFYYDTVPTLLPKGVHDWFAEFPNRCNEQVDPLVQNEDLVAYIDNTYFFSRSARDYVFPEICALEDDIMQSMPSFLISELQLPKTVESTGDLSRFIAERWVLVQQSQVVPDDRRLRRFSISRIKGVKRNPKGVDLFPEGWMLTGKLSGGWERVVDTSVDFHLLEVEVQLYAGNVGVVLLTVGVPKDEAEDLEYLKNLSALTKDVLPPNTDLPVANLFISGIPVTWLEILTEVTGPFRIGNCPNAGSLFTPRNQEFGQHFRRFWYLPEHDMVEAFNIVRVNYLQPFFIEGERSIRKSCPETVFNFGEGWNGLIHHHEFVISGDCPQQGIDGTNWWYRNRLAGVVFKDYSWLWLLAIVQRVRLGRLLANLDISSPSTAEAELQEFYDFMQEENFAIPSTQIVGNQLAKKLNELLVGDELIKQIEIEAGVIRESVLQRASRVQAAALAVIALVGTWFSLVELADDNGKWNLGWFTQPETWLALPLIYVVYRFTGYIHQRKSRPRR